MQDKSFHSGYLLNTLFQSLETFLFSRKLIYPILIFFGILSGLKLFAVSVYLSLFTILIFFYLVLISRKGEAASLLIISLYLIVNYEASTTPSIVRYLIYGSAIVFYLSNLSMPISKKALLSFFCLCFFLVLASLGSSFKNYIVFDYSTLIRDLFVLLVLFTFCLQAKAIKLNLALVFYLLLGILFGELIYIATSEYSVYFNYSSVKTLILFVPFYLFQTGRTKLGIFSFLLCLVVISNYGTRMIILSLIIFSFISAFIYVYKSKNIKLLFISSIVLTAIITIIGYLLSFQFLLGFKSIAFLQEFYNPESFSINDILKILDPVRYAEHEIFFSRNYFEILFGNGLGAGIKDVDGHLGFVNFYQSAFSQEEINTNIFFNLHDYWTDYGLRFGLIAVIAIIFFVSIRPMLNGEYFIGIFLGVLLICTTYSGSGILILILLIRFANFIYVRKIDLNTTN